MRFLLMKWLTRKDSKLIDFIALLSDDALSFFEKSLDKFQIVGSPFSIQINSYVSIQCVVMNNIAYILSFNYGRYLNLNTGRTAKEIDFIRMLENKYFESDTLIHLSSKNKLKLLSLR